MRLILVRHGQTTSNVAGLLDTAEPGASLTDLGREQAQALGPALTGQDVDAIWWSTLVRTHETGAPLAAARGLSGIERAGLKEIQAGDLEMAGDTESVLRYVGVVEGWLDGVLDARMPGGEDGHEVLARFDAVVEEIAAAGVGAAVVVSHGAILRLWALTRASNVTARAGHPHLSNTGVVVLEGSPDGRWRMLRWEENAIGGEVLTDRGHDGPTA